MTIKLRHSFSLTFIFDSDLLRCTVASELHPSAYTRVFLWIFFFFDARSYPELCSRVIYLRLSRVRAPLYELLFVVWRVRNWRTLWPFECAALITLDYNSQRYGACTLISLIWGRGSNNSDRILFKSASSTITVSGILGALHLPGLSTELLYSYRCYRRYSFLSKLSQLFSTSYAAAGRRFHFLSKDPKPRLVCLVNGETK